MESEAVDSVTVKVALPTSELPSYRLAFGGSILIVGNF